MANRRISMITLENFKGISEPVEIPLRPITLLFGKNSAGKSTILQAMLYVREILRTGRVDVDRVELGGDAINLGGFRNFVHNHETTRAVRIRFDIDLNYSGLTPFDDQDIDDVLGNVESIYVEFIGTFQKPPLLFKKSKCVKIFLVTSNKERKNA